VVAQKEVVENLALIAVGMTNLVGVLFSTQSKWVSYALYFLPAGKGGYGIYSGGTSIQFSVSSFFSQALGQSHKCDQKQGYTYFVLPY
jgi:hypothetical protein